MYQNGTWRPYSGTEALVLVVVLIVISGGLAFLGTRMRRPVGVSQPGKVVSAFLVVIWWLALATFLTAIVTYMTTLTQQVGTIDTPSNPISPVSFLCGLISLVAIAYMTRRRGFKIALGSAIVGTIAAPMIFELPFDLIVAWRTFPPAPAVQFTLLFFLPLFLLEISSFALLTVSPVTRISRYTLFSLAGMFFVFAIWAMFGFSYPLSALPIGLNAVSKVLSFVVAVTLFLPWEDRLAD